ncbi:MAG: hypothetical protein RBT06_08835, partial [Smithellaceae bacterium]|nr:hypothetical protein [Smithellaceae bacterium]
MASATFLNNIVVSPPLVKIYRRLGFKKTTSQISSKTQKETDRIITQATALISLRGSFTRLAINDNINGKISLDGDAIFHSKKLSVFLRDCKEAVFMGATAGNEITEAIKEKSTQGDLQAAVIYDATASEMA